jgi:threonine/homoserine/homoserine lactone efflux protein
MTSQVVIISFIYLLVGIPCIAFWLLGGVAVRRYMNNPRHLQIFNVTMGILLIASIILMLFGE